MKLTKKKLSLEEGMTKEWVITNGIGGFSSSTVLGANTRKYHGLLVAPLTPPARRYLLLSKVDEAIGIKGKKYPLYTNIGKTYISKGYENLVCFEKEILPKFTYLVEGVKVEKTICMEQGKNTVGILYEIETGEEAVSFTLAPLVNFRDFHSVANNHQFEVEQEQNKQNVKLIIDQNMEYPLYMKASEGTYQKHDQDMFYNMFYLEEEKRGFFPEENHSVVGVYEIKIAPNTKKEISFVCSMEEDIEQIEVKNLIKAEEKRMLEIIKKTKLIPVKRKSDLSKEEEQRHDLLKQYIITADSFITYRPNFGLHSIIAGYPWFLDWGRDTLISFEGLLLVTKRYQLAKEILLTFTRDIKYGLVPNGYCEYDNSPLYNSVDSSLLLFEQVEKYLRYTADYPFVKEKIYDHLVGILDEYEKGIDFDDNNIYLDQDGLLVAGTENTQNTWMDAKVNGVAVTPRNGKAVEINSMWYNALKVMEHLTIKLEGKEKAILYAKKAEKCKKAFAKVFVNEKKKCLYDVLGDEKIRPNQLFSLALTYPILDPNSKQAKEMMHTVAKQLLNKCGVKTLAKGEKDYVDVYEGDSIKRDSSYHQGITWPWLLGIYYDALKKVVEAEKVKSKQQEWQKEYDQWVRQVEQTFQRQMQEVGCLGSISELYDSKAPQLSKGAFSQAWSIAEILRIITGVKK